MNKKIIRNTDTGFFLGLGKNGDKEPELVEFVTDAWRTSRLSSYMLVAFELMKRGYRIEGISL